MFTNTVSKGMTKVAEILGSAVLQAFPGATPPQQGKDESNADFKIRSAKATEQQQAIISGFQAAVGGIGHELQMFKDAQGGKQTSVLANTVSMAAVGASIGSAINVGWGTIIGAIVGAIIGAVTAAIANAQAKAALPYAEYGVKDGKFYLSPMTGLEDHFKNITQKQYNDLMQQGTAAINSMTTGYIGLLLKFPMDVIASLGNLSLSSLNFKPTMYQQGGPGSPTTTPGMIWNPTVDWHAMQTFSQDLDNWLKNTMPKQIAALFKDRVSSAFVSMGMTVDDFNKIWTELDGLDPKAALAVLNDLADAFVAMRKVTDYAKNIGGGFANALASGTTLNASGEAMRGVTEFQQSVISAQEGIIKLAIAVATLPLAESAAAAVKLGQSLEQLQGNLTTFLNQVLAITKSISAEIQDLKYNDALGAATTNKQKTSILEARYKSDIAHADNWQKEGLSPDQVRAYIEDALKTAGQIRDLDPKGREAWYLKQIDQIDFWQQSIFKSIGEAAIAQTNAIMAQVSGILTGAGTIFADAMSALSASALAAANALNVISGVTPAAAASRTSSITTTGQSPAAAASYASTTSSSSTARNSTSQSVVVTVDDPSGFVQNVRAGRQTR